MLIWLVIVLAALAAFELGLRAFGVAALPPEPNHTTWRFRHDPELGWSARAGTAETMTVSRTVSMRYNSLGLRDIEPSPDASSRILFLGDSFAWGFDVEPEERFSDRLRAALPGVDIQNAGITGYGTDQEYLQLQRLWPRLQPKVVVLIFCTENDRQDNSSNYRYFTFKPYLAQVDGEWKFLGVPVPASSRHLIANSRLARRLTALRLAISAYISFRHRKTVVPDPTEILIAMMRDFVKSRGATFLVGLTRGDPALEVFLNAQEIRYVALDDVERFPDWGSHWSPAGHATVAERLLAPLERERAIPVAVETAPAVARA